jgi:mannose/fructose/N-acetylgalactosamine-specific phosphotransferase system component IID
MLRRTTILNMIFRSLFMQAAWNYERMQNLGFCFAITPALKEIYDDPQDQADAIKRHLEFFNTHPFLAAILVGISANLEEAACQGEASLTSAGSVKTRLMGTYGAIGDTFFWSTMQPLCSLCALLVLAIDPFVAAVVFLLLFNLPHLILMGWGLDGGYRHGTAFLEKIKKLNLIKMTERLRPVQDILIGLALGFWFIAGSEPLMSNYERYTATVAVLVTTVIGTLALKKGISPLWCVYSTVGLYGIVRFSI